jgi:hypothetical protein
MGRIISKIFVPQVSLGNIISVFGWLISLFIVIANLKERVAINEVQMKATISVLQHNVDATDNLTKEVATLRTLVEERTRRMP